MQFNKEQLYEIEKHFDLLAAQHIMNSGKIIEILGAHDTKKELLNKFIKESSETWDKLRSISALASTLREK